MFPVREADELQALLTSAVRRSKNDGLARIRNQTRLQALYFSRPVARTGTASFVLTFPRRSNYKRELMYCILFGQLISALLFVTDILWCILICFT